MKRIPDGIRKIGAIQMISDEQLFRSMSYRYEDFERKCNVIETPPSEEEWDEYREAQKAYAVLDDYDGMEWGGPDYGPELNPPQTKITYEWLETAEEWLTRCREIMKGWNED